MLQSPRSWTYKEDASIRARANFSKEDRLGQAGFAMTKESRVHRVPSATCAHLYALVFGTCSSRNAKQSCRNRPCSYKNSWRCIVTLHEVVLEASRDEDEFPGFFTGTSHASSTHKLPCLMHFPLHLEKT